MAVAKTKHTKIKGVSVTLPKNKMSVLDLGNDNFPKEEIETIVKGVGAKYLYEADENYTASDLCFNSAEKLINDIGWNKDSIDGLIFVSQTPDYIAPATSCILQDRLGLPKTCVSLDINYGCSGFISGMFMANQLIETNTCKRVLVLIGDTLRRLSSKLDKGLYFILSDAGCAIAVEKTNSENRMITTMFSDGSGYKDLIVPAGGARLPKSEETGKMVEAEEGNVRCLDNYYMHGMNVFSFAIKKVPLAINDILEKINWEKKDVDYYFLHQANAYMVKYIAKRAKIDIDKCPINIDKYGNTSGVSIPLLLTDMFDKYKNDRIKAILCGFGVGLSWGCIATELYDIYCSEIQYM